MENEQIRMPLYQALLEYRASAATRMHTPGHKGGLGLPEPLKSGWRQVAELDITELPESDDLFAPWGPLRESQRLLAELYGAKQSFYLINGASVGLIAALLLLMPPSGGPRKVLLPRQAHRSLWSACILADLWPVCARIEVDRATALPLPVCVAELEKVLEAEPEIQVAVLLHPSYHGLCGDLKAQVELLHRHNLPVIVDEAHGTHLRFLPQPIPDALQVGADVTVQSPHKTAAALTQSAWMHCQGDRVDAVRLKAALGLLQSSSPSFPLMVGLEAARRQLALSGKEDWDLLCRHVYRLREEIASLPGLATLSPEQFGGAVAGLDPSKLYLRTWGVGLSGYGAAERLRSLGVSSEMADYHGVLWILGPGDDAAAFEALAHGLRTLGAEERKALPMMAEDFRPPELRRLCAPRRAWASQWYEVALTDAVGEIAAEMITPYPPGVPLVTPGEEISSEVIEFISELLRQGARVTGIAPETRRIKVVWQ